MLKLQQIEKAILDKGKVDKHELDMLREQVYSNGRIDLPKADFLVALHKRVQHRTPAFEQFFYQAIKDHVLAFDRFGADQADWLRRMLFADGKIDDEERRLLKEIRGEAKQVSPEFEAVYRECMKQPPEQHTSG